MRRKKSKSYRFVWVIVGLIATMFVTTPSYSTQSVSYDFDTAGQLTSEFDGYISSGTDLQQSSTGGINNSGAISTGGGSDNAVFASKDTYSLGGQGSTYTFTTYLQSVGNGGYSGMGFTSLVPSAATTGGFPFSPTDALGVSVHGGGFVFHNGATTYNGSWDQDNAGIATVKKATMFDLLNNGSPTDWYFVKLEISRSAGSEFDMRVEVWSADDTGTFLRPSEADAIFEITGLENTTLTSAPSIRSYVNFSGDRVRFFDNYQVSLVGSTVIQAGSPVVLTTSASGSEDTVQLVGSVSSDGGAAISERGFVYSTSTDPTLADSKVVVSGTTGAMTGTSPGLSTGTYFFRAFATNANGTSYGENKSVSVTGSPEVTGDAGDSPRAPALPMLESYSIQKANGSQLRIEGVRLWCINSLTIDGTEVTFETGFSTPWYEYIRADITGIEPGPKTLVAQSCMGEVTYENWLTISAVVGPKSTWMKAQSFGLNEAMRSKIAAFNSSLGDGYFKIRCIVNSANGEDMNEAFAKQICAFAQSNDLWRAEVVHETKATFDGTGYWVNIWASGG